MPKTAIIIEHDNDLSRLELEGLVEMALEEADAGMKVVPAETIERIHNLDWSLRDDAVAFWWATEDVIGRALESNQAVTEEQAQDILNNMHRRHDANMGISWDVIDIYTDMELSGDWD